MKVLVTGATGFIGQHLCRALAEKYVDFYVSTSSHGITRQFVRCCD